MDIGLARAPWPGNDTHHSWGGRPRSHDTITDIDTCTYSVAFMNPPGNQLEFGGEPTKKFSTSRFVSNLAACLWLGAGSMTFDVLFVYLSGGANSEFEFREKAPLLFFQERQPFALHFCNYPTEGALHHVLTKSGRLAEKPIAMWEQDFMMLEHFPKEKLVYLSPDSINTLRKFSHEDIYIIGGPCLFG